MVVPMGSKKEKRRRYTKEYRAEAVLLVEESGKSVRQVAEDLGINATSLYAWVRQARVDRGGGPAGALTTEEIEELRKLRKEVKELRRERDFLKKTAAYFAECQK